MRTPGPPRRLADPPIVVLIDSRQERPLAAYLAEMLRIEGLNWVAVRDLARAPLAVDEALPRCVLVAPIDLSEGDAARLAAHVEGGGRLLAARPGPALSRALGLAGPTPIWPEAPSRYIVLDGGCAVAVDLPWVSAGVQCFGDVAAYVPGEQGHAGDEVAAWLAPFPVQRTRFPAAVCLRRGTGRAAVTAFDPAESAVRQQQGTPSQSSAGALPDFDGDGAYRATELFLGQLDPGLRDVPQADLQRTLLLRLLEWLTEGAPLPRLWRFPRGAPAMALFDGDSDSMSLEDFRLAIATCDRYDAPFTTFLKPEHVEMVDAAEVAAVRARGHAFGPHPWAGPQPSVAALRDVLARDCAGFAAKYGYRPRAHRGHWVIWPGWVEHARSLAEAGIQLDTNFTAGRFFKGGYVNGSGLPLRFVDKRGALLDVAEQATISTDDGWLSSKNDLPALTIAEAITRSCRQIDDALERYHTVVHPYFHPVSLKGGRALPYPTLPWLEAMLAHCRRRGVPFLEMERWIDWNHARHAVTLAEYAADQGEVRFTLAAGETIDDVSALLPLPAGSGAVEVLVDGELVAGEIVVERHGRRYAAATLSIRAQDERHVAVRWR